MFSWYYNQESDIKIKKKNLENPFLMMNVNWLALLIDSEEYFANSSGGSTLFLMFIMHVDLEMQLHAGSLLFLGSIWSKRRHDGLWYTDTIVLIFIWYLHNQTSLDLLMPDDNAAHILILTTVYGFVIEYHFSILSLK